MAGNIVIERLCVGWCVWMQEALEDKLKVQRAWLGIPLPFTLQSVSSSFRHHCQTGSPADIASDRHNPGDRSWYPLGQYTRKL